jgi:hypothetical protein
VKTKSLVAPKALRRRIKTDAAMKAKVEKLMNGQCRMTHGGEKHEPESSGALGLKSAKPGRLLVSLPLHSPDLSPPGNE